MTTEEIKEQIRVRFASVRERARVLAQALKVRAEIMAAKRRLRGACAELGEEVYGRLAAQSAGALQEDPAIQEFRLRIEGIRAEIRQLERALAAVLAGSKAGAEGGATSTSSESEGAAAV